MSRSITVLLLFLIQLFIAFSVSAFQVAQAATAPVVSSVSPNPMSPLNSNQLMTISGSHFQSSATLTFTDPIGNIYFSKAIKFTFISSNQLNYQINNSSAIGTWSVRVNNPDGQVSNSTNFSVQAVASPAPVISSVSPNPMDPLSSNQPITISGSHFQSGATLTFTDTIGKSIPSSASKLTFISSNQLKYEINNNSAIGTWSVKVNNPDGQISNVLSFSVVAPTTTVLSNPTNLIAKSFSDHILLTWEDKSNNETGFKVERKAGVSGTWTEANVTAQNIALYQDFSVIPGVTYNYRVYAYDTSENVSGYSNEYTATIQANLPTVNWTTPPPSNITSGQTYSLAWSISGGDIAHTNIHWDTDSARLKTTNALNSTNNSCTLPCTASHFTNNTVVAPTAGTWYFVAHAKLDGVDYWSSIQTITVNSSCNQSTTTTVSLSIDVEENGCVANKKVQYYSFQTQVNLNYTIILTPTSGNPDLYIGSSETCVAQALIDQPCYLVDPLRYPGMTQEKRHFLANASGTHYIGVHGYDDSEYSLRVDSKPRAIIDANSNAPATNDPVTFTAEKSIGPSPACDIKSYSWNFGDGETASGIRVTHSYSSSNGGKPYRVELTVTDCNEQPSDTASMNVTVSAKTAGCNNQQSCSADPVNLATGNYTYERADLSISGIGIPFEFKRSYNSKDAHLRNGPLSFGWTHSYNIRLVSGTGYVEIIFGGGDKETYLNNGDNTYRTDPGIYNTLTNNGDGTYTLTTKQQLKYNFDSQGRLSSIADKNSNALTMAYDTSGNLISVTDTAGRIIDFAYDTSRRLTQLTDPMGRTVLFSYDTNGDLISATDPNGGVTQYVYDLNHQITEVIDPRGNTLVSNVYDDQRRVVESQKDALDHQTRFEYDFETRVTTVTDALDNKAYHYHDENLRIVSIKDHQGNSQSFAYDENNNRTRVTDKNGYTIEYDYDATGNVTSKTDPLGNITTINYDTNNNPIARTDPLGNTTSFTYDVIGNLTQTQDVLENTTIVTYNDSGLPLTMTDGRGNTTTQTYDPKGNLIKVKDALGNTTIYTYDEVGRRLTQVDALSHTTHYIYDSNDNPLTITDPNNKTISHTYDENNNRINTTDKKNNITQFIYDKKDRMTTTTDVLGGVISNTYDALDRRIAITDRNNNTSQNEYDDIGNLIKVTDALDNETTFTYDPNGNRLKTTDPLGNTIAYAYDALNRQVSVTDPLGATTTTAYDKLGRVMVTTNAKGQSTGFTYDATGKIIQVTDANGGIVQYTYDENGNRLSMTDANDNTTTYTYDELNRLVRKIEPLGNKVQYQYDKVGNIIQVTQPNNDVIQYTYDNLDRLTTITYPDNSIVSFSYDANGNRTQMIDSLGTQKFIYDKLDRMITHTDPFANSVGYDYDANGNRTTLTYPDNKVVAYTYDKLNRMISVSDWLNNTTTYRYDTAGKLINTLNPNGTVATYGYDKASRLTGLINAKADSSIISSYNYTLDSIGNHTREQRDEPLIPILTPGIVNYTYDTENQLTDASGIVNNFDANGNRIIKGTDSYFYDYENRLVQTTIGEVITHYQYDGLGNRYTKTTGETTTKYILDINTSLTNVLAETDADNNISAYNIYGLGLISRIQSDDTISYYHYDSHGSTIALTDSRATITDLYAYDPFGKLANKTGSTANPFTYIGRHGVLDEGHDLFYIRARYYDSDQQRFVSKDAKAGNDRDGQSLNRYVYGLNNPVILIDVSGFSPNEVVSGSATDNSEPTGSDLFVNLLIDGSSIALEKVGLPKIINRNGFNNVGKIAFSAYQSMPVIGLYLEIYKTLPRNNLKFGMPSLRNFKEIKELSLEDWEYGVATGNAIVWNTLSGPLNFVLNLFSGGQWDISLTPEAVKTGARKYIETVDKGLDLYQKNFIEKPGKYFGEKLYDRCSEKWCGLGLF